MKKKILLFLVIILLLPIKVQASIYGSSELKCYNEQNFEITNENKKVSPGEKITCNLTGRIEEANLASYHGKIELGDNLTLIEITPSTETWSIAENEPGTTIMDYVSKANITGNYDIARIEVKANENLTNGADTSISIAEPKYSGFTGQNGNEIDNQVSLTPQVKRIRIVSTNNFLSGLTLSQGTLTPEFNKNILNYTATVESDVNTITINTTPEVNVSTVTGAGEKSLNYGTNEVTITVKSESNVTKEYKVLITRKDNRSTASDLLDFALYNYDINFDKAVTNYTLKVDNNIIKLALCNARPTTKDTLCINNNTSFSVDDKAEISEIKFNNIDILEKIETGNNIELGDIKEGENILTIVIKSENESSKTYRFTITKGNSTKTKNATITEDKGTIKNPKTGSAFIFAILSIMIISIGFIFYYYKKNQKSNVE